MDLLLKYNSKIQAKHQTSVTSSNFKKIKTFGNFQKMFKKEKSQEKIKLSIKKLNSVKFTFKNKH